MTEPSRKPMRKADAVRRAVAVETGIAAAALIASRRNRSAALAIAGLGVVAARGAFGRNSPLFGRVTDRGPSTVPRIALTFDDGPGPSTPAVLDALLAAGARATFFVLGRQVETHPDIVARIADEGHQIANHGYDHGILVFRDPAHVRDQLLRTERAVAAIAGPDAMTRLFRAPHGFRGPLTSRAAAGAGYRTVGWTTGVFDSAQPGADVIAARVARALEPGAVILLHDADGWDPTASRSQTAEAIPTICERARGMGLEPSPLSAVLTP